MKAPAPTKGVKPVFTGVSGVLVDAAPPDILFGEKKNRKASPYDALLEQLKSAGHGKFLKFEDLRARPSIIARSKKLNIKVLFGEQGSTLWVTLAKVELQTDGVADEPVKPSMSDVVFAAIKAGRSTSGEIVTWARSNGASGIGITQVDGLLINLARGQKIKMKPSKGVGSDQPERWIVA